MTIVVRRCTKCGSVDPKLHWKSIPDAVKSNALPPSWACPNCAWPEGELVEVDETKDASHTKQEETAGSLPRR